MKQGLVFFIAVIFFIISGCQLGTGNRSSETVDTNSVITKLLKSDILEKNTNITDISKESGGFTEVIGEKDEVAVSKTNALVAKEEVKTNEVKNVAVSSVSSAAKSVQNEVVSSSQPKKDIEKPKELEKTALASDNNTTKDKPITAPTKKVEDEGKQIVAVSEMDGSYIKIGNDTIGQSVSPRSFMKMTFVVFDKGVSSTTVDFKAYVVPKGNSLKKYNYYLIGSAYGIEVVKGQSQFTRFWDGINYNGDYLPKGSYSVYLEYTVRDKNGNALKTEGRYWGGNQNYYIRLY